MKQFSLILIISFLATNILFANPIDRNTAQKAAANFIKSNISMTKSAAQPTITYTQKTDNPALHRQVNSFYIFNNENSFVIVAADDRITPILGYSNESTFDLEKIPVQLKDLLKSYNDEIGSILASSQSASLYEAEWQPILSNNINTTSKGTPVVPPLLKTQWAQSPLYNNLCPADNASESGHAVVGCVATAMSQVIRYWEYPVHGIGTHTYLANNKRLGYGDYGEISVDFAAATYDYANMPKRLNSSSSEAQINAVATLCHHCGVSVDMFYGPKSSGSFTENAAQAFVKRFNYPENVQMLYRKDYTDEIWTSMLRAELDAGHPMVYNGNGDAGGHSFVCDGYDDQNFFHFNWGWSGYADGYFLVSNLNPIEPYTFHNGSGAIFNVDAKTPQLFASTDSLIFVSLTGEQSSSKTFSVKGYFLSNDIQIELSKGFEISTDGENFANTASLSKTGGEVFLRFDAQEGTVTQGTLTLDAGNLKSIIPLKGYIVEPVCGAATHLQYDINAGESVELAWDAPEEIATRQTITWNTASNNGILYTQDYQAYQLHRFDVTDLAPYHLQYLTSISFVAKPEATKYKIIVYQGGSLFNNKIIPGHLILSQDVDLTSLKYNNWNTIELTEPVMIDANQELWYGIYVEAPASTTALRFGRCSQNGKGNILGMIHGDEISWNLNDNGLCNALKAEIGMTEKELLSYEISRDNKHLADVQGLSYIDSLKEQGSFNYKITANWKNGCSSAIEQKIIVTIIPDGECAISVPYSTDFDNNIQGTAGESSSNVKCWNRLSSSAEQAHIGKEQHNGTNAYDFGWPANGYTMGILPPVKNGIKVRNLTIEFDAIATATTANLEIGVMNDPADISSFKVITTISGSDMMLLGWKHYIIPFTNYTGVGKYIAFRNVATGQFAGARIDNLQLNYTIQPAPTNVQLSAKGSKVTIDWTDTKPATQWKIEYGLHGATESGMSAGSGKMVSVNQHPATLDLDYGETYDFYVYAVYEDNTLSTPSAQRYIHTDDCAEGMQCHYTLTWTTKNSVGSVNNGLKLFDKNGIWVKEYYLPQGQQSAQYDIAICNDSKAIFGFARGTSATEFTNFTITDQDLNVVAKVENGSVQPSSYNNATVKTGIIYNNGTFASPWLVLNATCETCRIPAEFSVSDISSNSAQVAWLTETGSSVKDFVVEYMEDGADDWSSSEAITSNSFTLSSLKEATRYAVRLKVTCDNGRIDYTDIQWFSTKAIVNIKSIGNGFVSPEGKQMITPYDTLHLICTPSKSTYLISLVINDEQKKEEASIMGGEVRCDYIVTEHTEVFARFANITNISKQLCADELPFTFGNARFEKGTESGNYIIHFLTEDGLDSLVRLNLTIDYPPTPIICKVSVDDNNYNHIYWEPTDTVTYFNIYRKNFSTQEFDIVANLRFSDQYEWIDSSADASFASYSYQMNIVDKCFSESEYSTTHSSIYLTKLRDSQNGISLRWNAYEGADVKKYYLYAGTGSTDMKVIATLDNQTLTYQDANGTGETCYQIAAELTFSCLNSNDDKLIRSNKIGCNNVNIDNNSLASPNFTVLPNPTCDKIQVILNNYLWTNGRIELYDIYGKLILCYPNPEQNQIIDLQPYANGMYLLRLMDGNQIIGTTKIVKD